MNRRKKANQILKRKHKKAMAKVNPKPKRNYVAKAEREPLVPMVEQKVDDAD